MTCFADYARYYNLLYKDKDYAGEAQYVHELIQKHKPGAKTILNLGCGTGNHDFEFARLGYAVTGIDMSPEMLAVAGKRLSDQTTQRANLDFIQGDIRTARLNKTFDVVISLFHVMSYQATNNDLQAAFATARTHLDPGGLFLFDCWYGPAVLSELPSVRIKRFEDPQTVVTRIAEPIMNTDENLVEVQYQFFIKDKLSDNIHEIHERHCMRYFFLTEIRSLFTSAGMTLVFTQEWLTGKESGTDTWGVCFGGVRV